MDYNNTDIQYVMKVNIALAAKFTSEHIPYDNFLFNGPLYANDEILTKTIRCALLDNFTELDVLINSLLADDTEFVNKLIYYPLFSNYIRTNNFKRIQHKLPISESLLYDLLKDEGSVAFLHGSIVDSVLSINSTIIS